MKAGTIWGLLKTIFMTRRQTTVSAQDVKSAAVWVVCSQMNKFPKEKRYVLVQIASDREKGAASSVAVGYLKYAAGDMSCPYFVVPGFGRAFTVTHWCDCLGDDFKAPLWRGGQIY
jgi:hypothetical protein